MPKPKLCQKMGHSHYLVICCQSEILQLCGPWWNHYIQEVCSADRWAALKRPSSSPQQYLITQPVLHKLKKLGYEILPHPLYLPVLLPTTTSSSILQLFAGKMLLQPAGGRKCFPRVCWISKHRFLCYRNKQTFLVGKNVLTGMVPILINKDVFEPSYSDLKFMVWNRSYFFTNLILG